MAARHSRHWATHKINVFSHSTVWARNCQPWRPQSNRLLADVRGRLTKRLLKGPALNRPNGAFRSTFRIGSLAAFFLGAGVLLRGDQAVYRDLEERRIDLQGGPHAALSKTFEGQKHSPFIRRESSPRATWDNIINGVFKDVSSNGVSPYSAREVIIAANVAVFVVWKLVSGLGGSKLLFNHFVASPRSFHPLRFHSLLLSGLTHASLGHLLFNCFALYALLSPNGVGALPKKDIFNVYLLSSTAAAIGQVLLSRQRVVGASGAVMAYALIESFLHPHQRWVLFFPFPGLELSSVQIAQMLLVFNALFALKAGRSTRGSVAWFAHLVGMAVGYAYVLKSQYSQQNDHFTQKMPTLSHSYQAWRYAIADFGDSTRMFVVRHRIRMCGDAQEAHQLNLHLDELKKRKVNRQMNRAARINEARSGRYRSESQP